MTRSKKVWAENIAEKFKKDVLGEKYDGLPQRSGLPKRLFEQLRSYSISLDLNGDLYICYPRMVEFPTNPFGDIGFTKDGKSKPILSFPHSDGTYSRKFHSSHGARAYTPSGQLITMMLFNLGDEFSDEEIKEITCWPKVMTQINGPNFKGKIKMSNEFDLQRFGRNPSSYGIVSKSGLEKPSSQMIPARQSSEGWVERIVGSYMRGNFSSYSAKEVVRLREGLTDILGNCEFPEFAKDQLEKYHDKGLVCVGGWE